jgi:phosphoserine phosphatase
VDDGYAWGTSVLAAADEAEVVSSAAEAWARHRPRLLPPVANVLRGLAAAGVDVAIVSASNRWVIEVAVAELGVSPDRVVAVDLVRDGGRLSSVVAQPMPNGAGKVQAIDRHLGRRPVLAFGNSVHDVPMLESAALGVLVLATTPEQGDLTPALEAHRAAADWVYFPVAHPLRGPAAP